jgi:hypothetical protein
MHSSENLLRQLIRESIASLDEKRQHEYGSQQHLDELDELIGDIRGLKDSLRKGPNRLKHRKEMHRLQDAIGAIRYLKSVAKRSGIKNGLLAEGGLKAQELTGGVVLDPKTARDAASVYISVIEMWNSQHLIPSGLDPVTPIRAVGSTSYYDVDSPEEVYGDVDYLVSFPVNIEAGSTEQEIRDSENRVNKVYEEEFVNFLNSSTAVQQYVNVDATLKSEISPAKRGSPLLVIVKMPDGRHVQVDTIVTFSRFIPNESGEEWMPARWTPERGKKGYTIGHLYTALGNYFNMSIGDRGVLAKVRDGQRVPFSQRKGTTLTSISKNIRTFLRDIAVELAGPGVVENELLIRYPGVDPDNITIADLAKGIRGLALTLEASGIEESSDEMLGAILNLYASGLKKNIDSKLSRGLDQKSYDKLDKLNSTVYSIVSDVFAGGDVDSGLLHI